MPPIKPTLPSAGALDVQTTSSALRDYLIQHRPDYQLTLGGVENIVGVFEACLDQRLQAGDSQAILNALNDAATECKNSGTHLEYLGVHARQSLAPFMGNAETDDSRSTTFMGDRPRVKRVLVRVGLEGLTPAETLRETDVAMRPDEDEDDEDRQTPMRPFLAPSAAMSRPTAPFPAGFEQSAIPVRTPARATVDLGHVPQRPSTPWSVRTPSAAQQPEARDAQAERFVEVSGRRLQIAAAVGVLAIVGATAVTASERRGSTTKNDELVLVDAGLDAGNPAETEIALDASAGVEIGLDAGVAPLPTLSASAPIREPKKAPNSVPLSTPNQKKRLPFE